MLHLPYPRESNQELGSTHSNFKVAATNENAPQYRSILKGKKITIDIRGTICLLHHLLALGGLVISVIANGPKVRGIQTRPRSTDF
jgi:hypothetical protein